MEQIALAEIRKVYWDMTAGFCQWIILEGDGWGVGFGGENLKVDNRCYQWLQGIAQVLELPQQYCDNDLIGKIVRTKIERNECIAIGHPIKDQWFYVGWNKTEVL